MLLSLQLTAARCRRSLCSAVLLAVCSLILLLLGFAITGADVAGKNSRLLHLRFTAGMLEEQQKSAVSCKA